MQAQPKQTGGLATRSKVWKNTGNPALARGAAAARVRSRSRAPK
jgi:hypothetical protein